jgi:CHASE3 domain sensor protein
MTHPGATPTGAAPNRASPTGATPTGATPTGPKRTGGAPGAAAPEADVGETGAAFVRRTLALLAAGTALLLVLATVAVVLATRSDDLVERVQEAQRVRSLNTQVFANLRDAETGQRGYLLTGEETYLAPYEAGHDWLRARLPAMRASARPPRAASPSWSRASSRMEETIALARAGRREEAIALVRTDRGKARWTSCAPSWRNARRCGTASWRRAGGALLHRRMVTVTTILGTAAIFLLVAGAAWIVWRYVAALRARRRRSPP